MTHYPVAGRRYSSRIDKVTTGSVDVRQQRRYGAVPRDIQMRRDFRQRQQHERAFVQMRVR